MTLKGNMLLKAGVPALLLVMSLVVIKGCSSGEGETETAASSSGGGDGARTLTQEEMDALGISGDSAQDTVATLVGKMNSWERQRQAYVDRMEQLLAENDRLTREAANVDSAGKFRILAIRQFLPTRLFDTAMNASVTARRVAFTNGSEVMVS